MWMEISMLRWPVSTDKLTLMCVWNTECMNLNAFTTWADKAIAAKAF